MSPAGALGNSGTTFQLRPRSRRRQVRPASAWRGAKQVAKCILLDLGLIWRLMPEFSSELASAGQGAHQVAMLQAQAAQRGTFWGQVPELRPRCILSAR